MEVEYFLSWTSDDQQNTGLILWLLHASLWYLRPSLAPSPVCFSICGHCGIIANGDLNSIEIVYYEIQRMLKISLQRVLLLELGAQDIETKC